MPPVERVLWAASDIALLPRPNEMARPRWPMPLGGPSQTGTLVLAGAGRDCSPGPGREWYKGRTYIQPVGGPDLNPQTLRTLDLGRPLGVPLRVHVPGVVILTATHAAAGLLLCRFARPEWPLAIELAA